VFSKRPQQKQPIELTLEQKSQQFIEHIVNGRQTAAEALLKSLNEPDKKYLLTKSYRIKDPAGRQFYDITALQYAVWALDTFMWEMLLQQLSPQEAAQQIQDMPKASWVSQYKLHANWDPLVTDLQTYLDSASGLAQIFINKVGNQQMLLPLNVIQEFSKPWDTPIGTRSETITTKISKGFGARHAPWYDNYVSPLFGPTLSLGNGIAYFRGNKDCRKDCPRGARDLNVGRPETQSGTNESGNPYTVHRAGGDYYHLIGPDIIIYKDLYRSRMEKYATLLQKLGVNLDSPPSYSPGLNK
jgi:hypothetical protein